MHRPAIVFTGLHVCWFIAGAAVTASFATSGATGHPPGYVFVPLVVIFWALGHGLIKTGQQLTLRGEHVDAARSSERGSWPPELAVLTAILGGCFAFGLFALIAQVLLVQQPPNHLSLYLLLWLTPAACCIGILLRKPWSRQLTSAVFLGAGAFVAYRMIVTLVDGRSHSTIIWTVAIGIVALCLFLAQHILRSARIRQFFSLVD
ncbi:MAG: hypothetical protein AAFO81_00975 [Pseudomonadota bacterium]